MNRALAVRLIPDVDNVEDQEVRKRHAMLAGWLSIIANIVLCAVKLILGLRAGSVSVVADAFHLLSHLANSVVLVVSFWVASMPATKRTPFGQGRMEHIAPLIMAIFLFITGLRIGEEAVHRILHPQSVHYFSALPWILAATIVIKQWVGQLARYLGKRIQSHALLANAKHQRIEAVISATVIAGLVAGKYLHVPRADGCIGLAACVWLLWLGWGHAKEAIVPLLGQPPSTETTNRIRRIATSVEGVEGVHEIIVHDYGRMYLISLHVEIPENLGPAATHEIAERCEEKLREAFGGEAVCHTDPLMERTEEVQEIENKFRGILAEFPQVTAYHDFRVIAHSNDTIIIVADLDAADDVPEDHFEEFASAIEKRTGREIPNLAYASFRVTPPFSY